MLEPGDRVVISVSGGPDSVCLLSVLHALAAELKISLHIAHLDHMFRGKESADEARFVDNLARKLGIPATIERIDVPAFCRARGLSPQAGAREVRYSFLNRVAQATGAGRIATGHTATDQAETFLMRLLRGAGVAGLSAIPPLRGNIIRPLIESTRDEVLEYLRGAGLTFVTDPSNAKPYYARNRIRLELIPVLKRFNPRIEETLASVAGLLRDEDEATAAHLATAMQCIITNGKDVTSLVRDKFNGLPLAFRRRIFRAMIAMAGLNPSELSLVQTDEALAFMATSQSGRSLSLPGGLQLVREYDQFVISAASTAQGFSYALTLPGTTIITELNLTVETQLTEKKEEYPVGENNLWQAVFDYDKIDPFLTIRSRRPGDTFCPSGMGGKSKKLQDYLINNKVPRRQRDRVPLLYAGADLMWVVGYRTDFRFLPGPDMKRALVVSVTMTGTRQEC
ncbi:MAG TPA: tRNA lysidine(34) synthetase TilS [Nitrospirota bacterium]|nr:tRNA lysidine(34) synthetase TilS [Nitrospirota bacterium]